MQLETRRRRVTAQQQTATAKAARSSIRMRSGSGDSEASERGERRLGRFEPRRRAGAGAGGADRVPALAQRGGVGGERGVGGGRGRRADAEPFAWLGQRGDRGEKRRARRLVEAARGDLDAAARHVIEERAGEARAQRSRRWPCRRAPPWSPAPARPRHRGAGEPAGRRRRARKAGPVAADIDARRAAAPARAPRRGRGKYRRRAPRRCRATMRSSTGSSSSQSAAQSLAGRDRDQQGPAHATGRIRCAGE